MNALFHVGMLFTREQVAVHKHHGSCWVILDGDVLDVTTFLSIHPGSALALAKPGRAGCDITDDFARIGHSSAARKTAAKYKIGQISSQRASTDKRAPFVSTSTAKSAQAWHAARRKAILAAHPEVAALEGTCPLTLGIGILVSCVHAAACVIVQSLPLWSAVIAATTVGAVCRMYSFGVAHELCHGTVTKWLRKPHLRQAALHLLTLPSIGPAMYEYYAHYHLGHHSQLGTKASGLSQTALHSLLQEV